MPENMPFSARIEPIFAYFFNIMSRNPSEKRLFDEIFQRLIEQVEFAVKTYLKKHAAFAIGY